MRTTRHGLLTVLFLWCGQMAAFAQAPQAATELTPPRVDPLQPFQSPWPTVPPPPTVLTRDVQVPAAEESLLCKEIAAKLQFGFPAGIRVQFPFSGGPNHYRVIEVFGGTEWTVLVASLGVRTIFELPFTDGHNAFVVGPGIHGVFFQPSGGDRAGGGVIVDTTLGWVFDRHLRHSWEVGFNLGLGLVATDRDVFPLPTFGFYGGFHF